MAAVLIGPTTKTTTKTTVSSLRDGWFGFQNRAGKIALLQKCRPALGPITPLNQWVSGILPRRKIGRSVKVITRLLLQPRIRMSWAITPRLLQWAGTTLPFNFCPTDVLNRTLLCKWCNAVPYVSPGCFVLLSKSRYIEHIHHSVDISHIARASDIRHCAVWWLPMLRTEILPPPWM
jgi:hypothetical protein